MDFRSKRPCFNLLSNSFHNHIGAFAYLLGNRYLWLSQGYFVVDRPLILRYNLFFPVITACNGFSRQPRIFFFFCRGIINVWIANMSQQLSLKYATNIIWTFSRNFYTDHENRSNFLWYVEKFNSQLDIHYRYHYHL